jgi:4-carboxymuconolactone decarboxylase
MPTDESIAKGIARFEELMGWNVDPAALQDDFARVTMGNLFGDVWSRPGLALRDRSLITVATLIAQGREQELKLHLQGALRVGISRAEIQEIILHLAHYAGWPLAVGAGRVAQAVFAEADQRGGGGG